MEVADQGYCRGDFSDYLLCFCFAISPVALSPVALRQQRMFTLKC